MSNLIPVFVRVGLIVFCTVVLSITGFTLRSIIELQRDRAQLEVRMIDIEKHADAIRQLELDVATINASRFTAKDGKDVWTEIAKIRQDMTRVAPPEWLVSRLDKLEAKIETVQKEVRAIIIP